MNKIIKILFLIVILPAPAWAVVCATTDIACRQLETMENAGVKPSTIHEADKTSEKTTGITVQPTQSNPFKITPPPSTSIKAKPPVVADTINKNEPIKTLNQQQNAAQPLNIYAPHQQNSPTMEQPKVNTNNKQKPFPIPKPSSGGIQYR